MLSNQEQEQEPTRNGRTPCEAEALLRAEQESERRASKPRPEQNATPVRILTG